MKYYVADWTNNSKRGRERGSGSREEDFHALSYCFEASTIKNGEEKLHYSRKQKKLQKRLMPKGLKLKTEQPGAATTVIGRKEKHWDTDRCTMIFSRRGRRCTMPEEVVLSMKQSGCMAGVWLNGRRSRDCRRGRQRWQWGFGSLCPSLNLLQQCPSSNPYLLLHFWIK